MAAHLTAAEYARLGLERPPSSAESSNRKRARTTRTETKGPYRSRCHACGLEFTVRAAETRHMTDTNHHIFDWVGDV